MSCIEKNEVFDYYQEVARSAFADMLHDNERNVKYSLALREAIQNVKANGKKANVLDIGTGTGLLAMLAAEHGADSVVTIEAFSPVSHIARKVIEKNGFGQKIKIVNKHSTEVSVGVGKDMEQKANILVAEVLDTELIGEGAISTYNHAHKHLMEKYCICVPDSALIFVQVVDCPTAVAWNTFKPICLPDGRFIECPQNVADCSGVPSIHDLQLSQLSTEAFKPLSEPLKICEFDFSGQTTINPSRNFTKKFTADVDGQANAIFFWWDIKMNPSGSILLSCAPHWCHPDTDTTANSKDETVRRNSIPWRDHWMQGCFYINSKLELKKDGSAVICACHDEFSWWFKMKQDEQESIERPMCVCSFHLVNSRNRISQINDRSKLIPYLKLFEEHEGKCFLFVGDHNLLALVAAAVQKASKIYLLEEDSFCRRSLENFISANNLINAIHMVKDLNELGTVEVSNVIAEPHFNSAALLWDNMTQFWKQIRRLKDVGKNIFEITPIGASIFAVPVRFLNLHKIRWPLKSTCGGFDHEIFDCVVELASSLADENVEPFSLWEYPCVALGAPTNIFNMSFKDDVIEASEKIINIGDGNETCNGVALWVEWNNDEKTRFSTGPLSDFKFGELISWKMSERQGVHLIPSSKIVAGTIKKIEIKTRFDQSNERLAMDFIYSYEKK